ncbi:TPA: IS21-like element ISPlge2 family transposase [Salmonella enterica]|nr:IS21 family transposase [Salmonella enterica subsp. enterica serovar Typhimurium]EKL0065608.1 IS21 family transposase [Salmonella enterica]HAU7313995.1 IS21 family transposase [Salmonella enterica subsp. enterica serovar Wangata]HDB9800404.1 IS21 family transposase [Escherichia coli]ELJ3325414.1 IS21 family transposase [Salmonella enterica]
MTLNTRQVSFYMAQRNKGLTQEAAAATTGISVRSGRRIEKGQWQSSGERHWRTRQDPLEAVWLSDVLPLLASRPQISPATVLEYLQDKYPGQYPDKVRRTLQRRIRTWKACHGEEREIMFRQEHQPGMRALSDFTQLKGTVITINGCPLEHKLFHFRLEWSRWSWMRVVTGGESFTALAEGLQEALGQLGGVPAEHRTDSLAAAWKNLSEEDHRDQTARYAGLCEHYGMTPSRNNSGRGHENGSVESAHGHLKERIRQALLLRGNNDFGSLNEYRQFVTQQVLRHNQRNQDLVRQELALLKPLPQRRCADYEELSVRVSSSSTINVRHVVYSVPSRLIGQMLKVRLWDDRLSCYVGSDEVMSSQRVRAPKGKRRARSINFRHVIGSLVMKPGAFYHATLRNDILPDDEWRQLWQRMCSRLAPQLASRLMVNALKLAAEREDISAVAKGLNQLLLEPGEPDLQKLLNWLGVKDKRPLPDGKLVQHSLQGYDNLMRKGGLQ